MYDLVDIKRSVIERAQGISENIRIKCRKNNTGEKKISKLLEFKNIMLRYAMFSPLVNSIKKLRIDPI